MVIIMWQKVVMTDEQDPNLISAIYNIKYSVWTLIYFLAIWSFLAQIKSLK